MKAKWLASTLALCALQLAPDGLLRAQEREDRTLLTQEQMTAIMNEVSGERAMHHVLELGAAPAEPVRLRAPSNWCRKHPLQKQRAASER